MPAKKKSPQTPSFEEAMNQLEDLVTKMEKGDMPLEASLEAFEEGIKLTKICQEALKAAEQKVEILSSPHPDAELESFDRES